jgi:hypothetical protein
VAHAADQLNVRRSAMLLQCQRGREDRQRVELLRAEQARRAAVTAEISAREQCDTHGTLHSVKVAEAYEAVRGIVVDLDALKSLSELEQNLGNEAAALRSVLADAEENLRAAELAVADASTALRLEIKATQRRERLADRTLAVWSQATEAAAETEREEQAIESWTAA